MEFRKYHALGNDYIVIDPREFPFMPEPAAIRAICDRNMGPGSDGILLGPLAALDDLDGIGAGPVRQGMVPWVRILNPDGSEAEKSGNGLRIFCLYLADQGYVGKDEFRVGTKGGIVSARVMSLDPPLIKVDMGEPSFSTGKAGLRTDLPEFIQEKLDLEGESLLASFVSMGNPHCVVFIDEPTSEMARRFGPLIENNPLFPERTNVQFAKVMDRHTLRIEIWERGAGYTLASGSSSCAAASVARRLGLVEGLVQVRMPGGTLSLDLCAPSILMTGPALCIYGGRFSDTMIGTLAAAGALPPANGRIRGETA
ncbi:MAG: diaminopimelate epimerase [Spirochaetae bacterium HGW-Spirochaetae-9]|nr:MAG: diaminopimelate epimerase [Spirochaetae bacterium HGW-Spirochaetae-9]